MAAPACWSATRILAGMLVRPTGFRRPYEFLFWDWGQFAHPMCEPPIMPGL